MFMLEIFVFPMCVLLHCRWRKPEILLFLVGIFPFPPKSENFLASPLPDPEKSGSTQPKSGKYGASYVPQLLLRRAAWHTVLRIPQLCAGRRVVAPVMSQLISTRGSLYSPRRASVQTHARAYWYDIKCKILSFAFKSYIYILYFLWRIFIENRSILS